jgi:hypothetical protein
VLDGKTRQRKSPIKPEAFNMARHIQNIITTSAISLAVIVISLSGATYAATSPAVTVLSPITQGMRAPVSVAVDTAGNIFVTDPRNGGVLKFNPYGKPARKIATSAIPQAVAIARDGSLLVSQGSFVAIIDGNGNETGRLGKGAGQFKQANGITVDVAGYIYVVDTADNCVQVFNAAGGPASTSAPAAGKPANSFGTYGTVAGQFSMPTAIAYERSANQVAVVDTLNGRVQFFSVASIYQKSIGSRGSNPLQFVSPQGVTFEYAADALSRMYVVDAFQSAVQAIDPAGTGVFLSYIGRYGTANGQLMTPSGVLFDAANRRLLVVNGFGNITSYGIDGGVNPVDNTPPTLGIDPVLATVSAPNLTITGTVEAGVTVIVTTNTAAVAGSVIYTSGTAWKCDITGLAPGANVITATAADAAGNTASQSVSVTFTVPAPVVTIDQTVPGLTNLANIIITGTVDTGATVTVANGATGVSGAATVNGTAWSYAAALVQGANTFTVSARKPFSDTATVSVTITLDSIPPALNVSALSDGSYTNNQTQNVSGTVSDENLAQVIVNNQPVTLVNGSFSVAVTLSVGPSTITVTAGDLAGNIATDTRTINFDNTAPVITIVSPADGSYTNLADATITGTTDKTTIVTIGGAAALMNGAGWSATVSLAVGQNTVEVVAADLYGNVSSEKRTITYDNMNPEVAIILPARDIATNKASATISGTAHDADPVTLIAAFNGAAIPLKLTNGTYSFSVTFPAEGGYPITVTATDAAGNVTTATRNITYDITPPSLTVYVDNPARPKYLKGMVEPGTVVAVTDKNGVLNALVTVTGNAWTADLTKAFYQYDMKTLAVVATDAAGNATVASATKFGK